MRFGFHIFMVDPSEFRRISPAPPTTDGWDSIQVADAPFFPEVTSAPYPYTPDGKRFWPLDTPGARPVGGHHRHGDGDQAHPLPSFGAAARPSASRCSRPRRSARWRRSPTTASRSASGSRGCPRSSSGSARTRRPAARARTRPFRSSASSSEAAWSSSTASTSTSTDCMMAPVPKKRIPIYVGGSTKPALKRAARYGDGWIGIVHTTNEIKGMVAELNALRREFGREKEPFDIMLHCPGRRDRRRHASLGGHRCHRPPSRAVDPARASWPSSACRPWRVQPPLAVKQEAIKRYAGEIIAKVS